YTLGTGRGLILVSKSRCAIENISLLGTQPHNPKPRRSQQSSIWTHVTLLRLGILKLQRYSVTIGPTITTDLSEDLKKVSR
ncbi:unnamed protein product, partial [Hymenolepis diminuta]